MVHYYGDYYDDDRVQVIQDIAIAGIVVVSLALLVLIVGCIHASRVMHRLVASSSSSSSAEKGLSTVVVQGTGPDDQPLVHPQQIQVQGPFFMTSHRTPDGEEMVMVPRRLLAQFQQQQRQQQQSVYQLPPVVPPKSATYFPQGLQQGDKAQIEEEQQQQRQQPNLNHATIHSQSTNEPAVMTQRKFEKSVKVEQDDDRGAGVGSGSDDVVAVVDKRPSSSSSEKKGEIEEIKTSA